MERMFPTSWGRRETQRRSYVSKNCVNFKVLYRRCVGLWYSTSVRLKVTEIIVARDTCRASSTPGSHHLCSAFPRAGRHPPQTQLPGRSLISEGVPWGEGAEGGGQGDEGALSVGPLLGSVTHWHYWCWADRRSKWLPVLILHRYLGTGEAPTGLAF